MRRSILATLIQTLITAVALFAGAFFGVRSLAPGPAYAQDEPEVVRATKFELVDAVGKTKASLHLSRVGEPLLFMYGTDGRVRLSLSVVGDEPGLDLRDSEGYDRFSLSAQNGGSTLTMLDARNHARLNLGFQEADGPTVTLNDEAQKPRLDLSCPEKGPTILFKDLRDRVTYQLPGER